MFAASASALGQQFLPKQKNTDEAGHKDAPIKDQVINWCAARVAAKDDEGRKHANEYAQLLNSVHGRPFNLVLYLWSLSADICRLTSVGLSLPAPCPDGTPAAAKPIIVEQAGSLRR